MEISLKTMKSLPYDPTIPLLGIYPEETITEYFNVHHTTIYNSYYMEEPRCPLIDICVDKEPVIQNGILLSYLKKGTYLNQF